MPRPPGKLVCGLSTRWWCAILKENELFAFMWMGPTALIAPGSALVGFGPRCWMLSLRGRSGGQMLAEIPSDPLPQNMQTITR